MQDLGGGVSQMATTTFNAMFFAGLEDVEHKPHSFYIDRYPVGREATVAWGAVDLRFRNDTPYGVLIDTSFTNCDAVVVGCGDRDHVLHEVLGHHHHHGRALQPHPARDPAHRLADVPRQRRASAASTSTWCATSTPVGENTETRDDEVFSTTYTPSDTVICTNPDAVDE